MQIVALGNCQINTSLKTSYQNVMIRKIVIVEDYFSKWICKMQIVALGNCQINTSLKTSYQNVMIRKIVIVEDYFSKCDNSR